MVVMSCPLDDFISFFMERIHAFKHNSIWRSKNQRLRYIESGFVLFLATIIDRCGCHVVRMQIHITMRISDEDVCLDGWVDVLLKLFDKTEEKQCAFFIGVDILISE